jgi:hypothetical protein
MAETDKLFNALLSLGAGAGAKALGLDDPTTQPTGYQGGIPQYDLVQEQVPNTYDPSRRPGSSGRRYFTDAQFVPRGNAAPLPTASGLASLNAGNTALANAMPIAGGVAAAAPPVTLPFSGIAAAPAPMAPASSGIAAAAGVPTLPGPYVPANPGDEFQRDPDMARLADDSGLRPYWHDDPSYDPEKERYDPNYLSAFLEKGRADYNPVTGDLIARQPR